MSKSSHVPTYRKHRQSGQAICTLADGLGGRRDVLLGKFGTAASRHEYARVISEWESSGRQLPRSAGDALTINEAILAYYKHCEQHYRKPDGTQTSELRNIRL